MLKFILTVTISALILLGIAWFFMPEPEIITMKTSKTYKPPLKIAVLSDTHIPVRAKKLPEKLFSKLKKENPDLILHAGDVVNQETIDKLEKIAPVRAAKGNMDSPQLELPKTVAIKVGKFKIGMLHNTLNPLSAKMLYTARENDLDMIIFGHTHRRVLEKKEEIWFLNPGSATAPKLQKPSFGLVNITKEKIEPEIIKLKK